MASLDLAVDRTSEVPLGTQLIWKLRTLIATGNVAPGERLPGLRELAEAAGVNINTVRSVFARLEEQGLLSSEHGRGTFVAADVRPASLLADMAAAALTQARAAGIDPRELAAALYVNLPDEHQPTQGSQQQPSERAERRALRAEIVQLEREVAALDPLGTIDPPRRDSAEPAPRVLSAAELRETRDAVAARVEELRDERDQWREETRALEQAEREAEREAGRARKHRSSRWQEAGVWTGSPRTRVSWTSP